MSTNSSESVFSYPFHADNLSTASTSVLPQPGEPGFASENLLTRGLQVPSRSDLITSGFLYPDILSHYDVSREHWDQFTRDITVEARLSRDQWTTAIGRGLGVLAVGGLMVGVLGAIPAIWVTRRTRRNREEQNLIIAASENEDRESRLSRKIDRWNETYFGPRGIMIRVDLPFEELEVMQSMDVSTSRDFDRSGGSGSGSRIGRGLRRKDDWIARQDASRRARIVVIPLQKGGGSEYGKEEGMD